MGIAYIQVEIGGQPLYQFSTDVLMEQVDVIQEINQHWWCYIRCRQTEDQRFPIEDSLGQDLQVSAFDEDNNQTYLFSGMVLEAELEYEIYGSYTARLTGVSKTYNMDITPRQKYYDVGDNSLAVVANYATSQAGLSAGGSPGPETLEMPLVQWGETDFKFLVRTADDLVYWFAPDAENGDIVNFYKEFADGPTLQWRTEDELISFRIRGKLSPPKMDGAHYDPLEGLSKVYQDVEGDPVFLGGAGQMVGKVQEQSTAKIKSGYVYNRRGAQSLAVYNVLLQKEANRAIETSVVATGISLNPAVGAGKKLTIQGVVEADGAYGVTKVVHHWKPEGYTNEFWCTASSEFRSPERPQKKPWYGVVVARVFNNVDPNNLGRIQVQYLWQEQGQTEWARMMSPHAGADRGFFFIPEIGDEVVVAFEDGDPERPILLGCLWNKPSTAPNEAFWGGEYSNDDVKRIVTKSGHRIQLVDKEGKESIVIATPTHLKISLLENTDEDGRPTMLLHSDGDILLSAPQGRIHCKSAFFSREIG